MARVIWAATAAVAALVCVAGATRSEDKPALDKDFLIKAVPHCNALIKYAELAEKRASSEQVKDLARRIVKEHKQLHADLVKAAEDQKVNVSTGGTDKTPPRPDVDRLSKLEGPAFDQAFMKVVVDDHERAVKMLEAQANLGLDAKLRDWAKAILPKMKEHLKEAKELQAKIKT